MTTLLPTVAVWLLDWLAASEAGAPLPRLATIARLCPVTVDAARIHEALGTLQREGKIRWRCGTRSQDRGHQAIRLIRTGQVLKTAGCPFEPPP